MIATVEMLNDHAKYREEYAAHFLQRTGDTCSLQAMRAGRLSIAEMLRLATYERDLCVRNSPPRIKGITA
jgi:hypothetical protein